MSRSSLPSRVLFPGLLVLGLGGLVGLSACGKSGASAEVKKQAPAAPVAIATVAAVKKPTPEVVTLTGTVAADERSDLTADTQGKVLAVLVERGQKVAMGAPLIRLDTRGAALGAREAQANLGSARAQRQLAEEECKRAQALFEKGAITKSQFDREQTNCTAALQQVAAAEARTALVVKSISDGVVRAPFAGEVAERFVSAGEWVSPGKPLITLVDADPLKVNLAVPEVNVSRVAVGQPVLLSVIAKPDQTFGAKVTRVGAEINAQSRALTVEATIDPGSALVPGMFVEARIVIAQVERPVVPRTAVVKRGRNQRLFVVVKGELEERVVQLGPSADPAEVSIIQGLAEGEVVALAPDDKTIDGLRVVDGPAAPAAPAAPTAPAATTAEKK